MPTNTPLGFTYPLGTDPPAGHTQMQELATDIDGWLAAHVNAVPVQWTIVLRQNGVNVPCNQGARFYVPMGKIALFAGGVSATGAGGTGNIDVSLPTATNLTGALYIGGGRVHGAGAWWLASPGSALLTAYQVAVPSTPITTPLASGNEIYFFGLYPIA